VDNYQPTRLGQVITGMDSKPIVVRVYGYEFDVLESKAEEVRAAIAGIGGMEDLQVEYLQMEPQVEIEVDLAAAERFQVKPGDVRRATTTLLSGLRVGNLYEEQKVFDVIVWSEPDIRANLTDIENLLIDTPGGGHVLLGEVADIRIAPTPINIKRDAVSRFIDVTANLSGRSYGAVASEIESALQGIDLPLEYHVELLGDFPQIQAAQRQTLLLAIVSAIGIFLLLQAAFWSWHLAFVVFITTLASLSGGILAALIAGGDISMGSLFGILVILGISIRYNIVSVRHMQNLEQEQGIEFGTQLVLQGAGERLKPVVMTAFGIGLAVLPMLVAGAIPGLEILQPMAIVVLGGLLTSPLLVLFVLPALYLRYGMKRDTVQTIETQQATTTTSS
jgi:Cu/Ag efflux pump CusA